MTLPFSHFKKVIPYWSLVCFTLSIALTAFSFILGVIGIALFGYFVFKDTANSVQGVGPVYWITRDYEKNQRLYLGSGFMLETSDPWRTGRGIQVSLLKKSFQIGICKKVNYKTEQDAELGVLGARFMDTRPTDIGNW